MPAILKIGVSRKASENFQSQGLSIDLQTELPVSAMEQPEELARQADFLFQVANDLLDEQGRKGQADPVQRYLPASQPHGNGAEANGNRFRTSNGAHGNHVQHRPANGERGNGQSPRGVTEAQLKAIHAMSKRLKADPELLATDEFGCTLKALNVRQGSELIDILKGRLEESGSRGGGR